jgi:ATP-dependent helicase HrpA
MGYDNGENNRAYREMSNAKKLSRDKRYSTAEVKELIGRIRSQMPKAMLKDRSFVQRQLYRLQKPGRHIDKRDVLKELVGLDKRLAASAAGRRTRSQRLPQVSFPRQLPIASRSRDIIKAIQENQVVILSGETGCGKSTQIPKMCLRAGRGVAGMIACTQPRRIAAITIAHRIAFELGENLGLSVGYKIRFRDRTSPEAFIKIMTDGMLLAETQSDPRLYAYDTLIIDEAHERSLNIDFLLGIARTLLVSRPELKLIITSATLDVEKFTQAFPHAPVIEVGGRQYPVDVEYCPAEFFSAKPEELDYVDLALEAVHYLKKKKPGDILVFMPTEQDILDTCERLEGRKYPGTTVLPLYARLPGTQQGRVYNVKGPKIVVATNVAETSLTIPGIRYVADTGLARISQYQPGTRIQSLPISPVSQSSADQRKGRCGRVEHGVCVRLYSEEDYIARPAFTPPEVMRSNLAEVILRMIDLRLGHPADFPFVDQPDPRHIKDGYDTLLELGAIDRKDQEYLLTEKGRVMASMPLDPKISRMLLEAREEGCLREVAIIAAALSIRDPRERPPDKADHADAAQASFLHQDSDFLTLLNIWDQFYSLQKKFSKSELRRFCREHFLSYPRMREWRHVRDQILAICEEQKIPLRRKERLDVSPALYAAIHRSILSGFLSNIAALKQRNFYTAAKNRAVMVFPGSTLFGKSRPWIVAAETVRTSRLFARTAARIDPGWLEALGGDLCRYSYSGEHWDKKRGEVVAMERVTLYGLEIVSDRPVSFGRIQSEKAHRIFIQSALVEGQLDSPPPFLRHNQALIRRVSTIEDKLRRRGFLVGEEALAEFYSRRLPGIYDERSLRKYLKDRGGDDFLRMSETDLLRHFPDEEELSGYPDYFQVGEQKLPLSYRFSIGSAEDGTTLKVPLSQLAGIPENALEWGIPGQFREKVAALVKGLPKRYRKLLVPVSEKVDIIVEEMERKEGSLYQVLSDFVRHRFQTDIPSSAWEESDIPPHLRMRVAAIGPEGKEIEASRDLKSLKKIKLTFEEPPSSAQWIRARKRWERKGITSWDMKTLPEEIPVGPYVNAYPALEPAAGEANLRLFASREEARKSHRLGVRNLLFLRFEKDLDFIKRYLVLPEESRNLALYFGGQEAVERHLMEALQKEALEKDLRSREEFDAFAENLPRELFAIGHALTEVTQKIIAAYYKVRMAIRDTSAGPLKDNKAVKNLLEEIRKELDSLVPKNFLSLYPLSRLEHFPRYLDALHLRVERGRYDPAKDRTKAEQVIPFIEALRSLQQEILKDSSLERETEIDEFRWMVEEFKVSMFAPELKTAQPISAKRLLSKLKTLREKA